MVGEQTRLCLLSDRDHLLRIRQLRPLALPGLRSVVDAPKVCRRYALEKLPTILGDPAGVIYFHLSLPARLLLTKQIVFSLLTILFFVFLIAAATSAVPLDRIRVNGQELIFWQLADGPDDFVP